MVEYIVIKHEYLQVTILFISIVFWLEKCIIENSTSYLKVTDDVHIKKSMVDNKKNAKSISCKR